MKIKGVHSTFLLGVFRTNHIKSDFLVPYRSKSSFSEKFSLGEAVWPLELTFMFDNVILYISPLWEHGRWIQTIPHSLWELNSVWGYLPVIIFMVVADLACPQLAITCPSQSNQSVIIVVQENLPGQGVTDCSGSQFEKKLQTEEYKSAKDRWERTVKCGERSGTEDEKRMNDVIDGGFNDSFANRIEHAY